MSELKFETPSLKKEPEIFIRLLKNSISSKMTESKFKRNQIEIRSDATKKLKSKLKWYHPSSYLIKAIIRITAKGLQNRENMRFSRTRAYSAIKDIFLTIGQLMVQEKYISSANDVFYLTLDEVENFCISSNSTAKKDKIEQVKKQYIKYKNIELPNRIVYNNTLPNFENKLSQVDNNDLVGLSVSHGNVEGEAIVINEPSWDLDVRNKILVTKMTDPGWVFLMIQASGLISEKGSSLSHTAIVGRELDIPVVVGVQNATSKIKTGDILKLDGKNGKIEIVKND